MTRIPQSPITTLGIPASVSISAPTGVRSGVRCELRQVEADGDGDRRGDEKRGERVTAVPKMKSAAPNLPVTASQSLLVRKPSPKVPSESRAWSTTL